MLFKKGSSLFPILHRGNVPTSKSNPIPLFISVVLENYFGGEGKGIIAGVFLEYNKESHKQLSEFMNLN